MTRQRGATATERLAEIRSIIDRGMRREKLMGDPKPTVRMGFAWIDARDEVRIYALTKPKPRKAKGKRR